MGFEKFKKYANQINEKLTQSELDLFMKNFLNTQALNVIAKTKLRTPVDTGALRASWQSSDVEKNGNNYSVTILNNMNYASFVEYGTVERNWKYKDGLFMLSKSLNEVEMRMHEDFDVKFSSFLKSKGVGE